MNLSSKYNRIIFLDYKYTFSRLLYLSTEGTLLLLCIFSCGLRLPSGVFSVQPEESRPLFVAGHVCYQYIVSIFRSPRMPSSLLRSRRAGFFLFVFWVCFFFLPAIERFARTQHLRHVPGPSRCLRPLEFLRRR